MTVQNSETPSEPDPSSMRVRILQMMDELKSMKPTREISLAVTNLQMAFFWLDEVNRLS